MIENKGGDDVEKGVFFFGVGDGCTLKMTVGVDRHRFIRWITDCLYRCLVCSGGLLDRVAPFVHIDISHLPVLYDGSFDVVAHRPIC